MFGCSAENLLGGWSYSFHMEEDGPCTRCLIFSPHFSILDSTYTYWLHLDSKIPAGDLVLGPGQDSALYLVINLFHFLPPSSPMTLPSLPLLSCLLDQRLFCFTLTTPPCYLPEIRPFPSVREKGTEIQLFCHLDCGQLRRRSFSHNAL